MTTQTHNIEIAVDATEAHEFAAWLNEQGHDAQVGNSTGSYIDGQWTQADQEASNILNALWDSFCNA